MHPAKAGSLLASDPGFQPVAAKAREITALLKLCFDFLPSEPARLVRTVNLRDSRLILIAATPAAAAKLKLLSDSLCKYLSEQGAKVNAVSVRVQPRDGRENVTREVAARRISASGINALQALYDKLPDSPARRALKTLLEHQLRPAPGAASPRSTPAPARRPRM